MFAKILQVFFLLVLCANAGIQNDPMYNLNVREAQSIFDGLFCFNCYQSDQCDGQAAYLSSLPETGHFNLSAKPIKENGYNVSFINFYRVQTTQTYRFPSGRLLEKNHSSVLYVPVDGAKIRGVVVYFHCSTLGKWNGPSSNGREYQNIAGLYASQGYAVLFPDLLGYRSDADPRPYLIYPQISVRSAVSTLNQIVPLLKGFVDITPNLYSVGFGEGGNYAVWLSKCIGFPEQCPAYTLSDLPEHVLALDTFYSLKGTVSMSGALDLQRTIYDSLTKSTGVYGRNNDYMVLNQLAHNLAKGYTAVSLLDGYLLYSLNISRKLSDFVADGFYQMDCEGLNQPEFCNITGEHMTIDEAFNSKGTESAITLAVGFSSLNKTYTGERTPYLGARLPDYIEGQNNNVLSLVSRRIFANMTFYDALIQASIIDYAQKASTPTFIWTLVYDSVVSSNSSRVFYKSGQANKMVSSYQFDNNKFSVCAMYSQEDPVDHQRGQIVGNIFALHFVKSHK